MILIVLIQLFGRGCLIFMLNIDLLHLVKKNLQVFLDDIVCSLAEQSKLDIYNIVELKPVMLGSQLFFLDESQRSDNVGALELNRQNTIDFILNTMFTSCSNFGFCGAAAVVWFCCIDAHVIGCGWSFESSGLCQ